MTQYETEPEEYTEYSQQLNELEEGIGCTEIWEKLEEKRREPSEKDLEP